MAAVHSTTTQNHKNPLVICLHQFPIASNILNELALDDYVDLSRTCRDLRIIIRDLSNILFSTPSYACRGFNPLATYLLCKVLNVDAEEDSPPNNLPSHGLYPRYPCKEHPDTYVNWFSLSGFLHIWCRHILRTINLDGTSVTDTIVNLLLQNDNYPSLESLSAKHCLKLELDTLLLNADLRWKSNNEQIKKLLVLLLTQ